MKKRKMTPLGIAIKKALIDKGMTQVELADSLDMSPKYLSHILYGERSGKKYIGRIELLLEIELESEKKQASELSDCRLKFEKHRDKEKFEQGYKRGNRDCRPH